MQPQETEGPGVSTAEEGSAPPPAAPESAPADGAQASPVDATPPAPAYTPNYSYDYENEKREITDPFWRSIIKDEESNKKVLEAFQMIDAFPKWKQKATESEETVQAVEELSKMFAKNDHDSVLQTLGYTDEMLFEIVRKKLEMSKLPPEQRQAFEEKRRLQLENDKLLKDNQKYQTEAMRELARTTEYQLDTELGKAEYKKVVDAYDGAYGSGAFKKRVASIGESEVVRLGRHIPPAELMQMVVRDYAPFLNQPSATPAAKPSVIPQVSGGSGTPGKKAVTSIEDLKKLRAQMVEDE